MDLLQLVRYTLRQFRKNPGFFCIAIAALALGIGANTAIFSAVEAVLLRPLPYGDPSRLAIVWEDASFIGFAHNTPAPANYVDWRAENHVFSDMAAFRYRSAALTGDQRPEQVVGGAVTPNFFDLLEVRPALGRVWTHEEDTANSPLVVISYRLWRRRFGGDPSIIGRNILMNGQGTTVIGVMPPEFFFPVRQIDYWAPGYFTPKVLAERDSHFLTVVARLKPGVTGAQAQSDMTLLAQILQKRYPDSDYKLGAVVIPISQEFAGDTRAGLWVLQIASIFVLLIACSNLANLLLSRASGRKRELAVRVALGAGRKQIVAQLLTESLMLALAGGALGLALGGVFWKVLGTLVPQQIDATSISLNGYVLVFTAGISIAAGVLFGLIPAMKATQVSLQEGLKEGARGGESRRSVFVRDALVAAQFALAFALLAGAGLMIQTLVNLRDVDLGFRADHLLISTVRLPRTKYDTDPKVRAFYRDVLAQVNSKPGVVSAGFTSDAPFTSEGDTESYIVEGERDNQWNDGLYREVTPGYLNAVGGRLIAGRFLDEHDTEASQPVVVVNEFLAKLHWPGGSAVGKHVRIGGPSQPWREVVGVVADIRERGLLLNDKAGNYLSTNQAKSPGGDFLVVRTQQDPLEAANAVRESVWAVDPEQPVAAVRSMDQIIDTNVSDRTRPMVLLAIFAGLALVLACIGVYGVLAYSVAQRTREIGVRMAIGARPMDVTRMIVGRGLKLGGLGLAIGAALALGLGRLMQSLLYGVKPASPAVYAATAGILLLVALLACVIPAQRAAHVDPVIALRSE